MPTFRGTDGLWEGHRVEEVASPEGFARDPLLVQIGGMRPDIVWFGEVPRELQRCFAALSRADLFVAIGTSGTVYPAAGFVSLVAARPETRTLEFNQEGTGNPLFHEVRLGPATQTVPAWVEELLA